MQRILGVLGAAAGEPRKPVQLPLMAVEQLFEGVPVARNMRVQQLGVTAFPLNVSPNVSPEAHGRTVANRLPHGTSPAKGQDAAWTVISEMSARLLPSVVPNVEIHTSRFDVGEPALTGMTL